MRWSDNGLSVRTFTSKIRTLKPCLCNWKQHVHDTHTYVGPTKAEFILNNSNNYHPSISFTFELEKSNEINFFDVLIKIVNNNKLKSGSK